MQKQYTNGLSKEVKTMDEHLDVLIKTGIILILAVLLGLLILAIATVLVNKVTCKTTVECPMTDCKHCKGGMCKLKDVQLQL